MGARYVLCGPAESPTDANTKQMLETEGYKLYENANPMNRFTLATSGRKVPPRTSLVLSRLSKEALITILKLT